MAPRLPKRSPLPGACLPVTLSGRMVNGSWQIENRDHLDVVTELDADGRRVGRDPLSGVTPAQLTAAGHPPRTAAQVASAIASDGGISGARDGLRLTTLRDRECIPCRDGRLGEVRRCAVINCPAWPYRMGRNPHNPRRGVNPFAAREPADA
jgi:hypothetical protein